MSMQLSEEQNSILKELKLIDPEQVFRGIPDTAIQSSIPEEHTNPNKIDMLFEVDYDTEHQLLKDKLLNYRKKSEQIYRVGELLKEYESKFTILMQDKDKLIDLLKTMKGSTSELVEKQKKMINLSMKMKESLDYYSYHNKFNFDYPCQVSCRQMYENILQQTLSQLADGIQFFQENTTYTQSKKYLGMFQSSRSKMLSFVKSFFIKLFSKESTFMNKHQKINFNGLIQNFYPKSKLKFISVFLVIYPQFASQLDHILKSIKQRASEEQIKFLEIKQNQIYEFQLNPSNQALIGYLYNYMPEIYDEAILHFFTYYRTNFHQNWLKVSSKREGTLSEIFHEKYIQCIYILTNEYAYMCHCCRANNYDKAESIRASIIALAKMYFQDLSRLVKDIRNKSSFQLCEIILRIKEDYPVFLERHMSEEYQSYAFGCVSTIINDPQHIQFLLSLFNSYANKFLGELEGLCFNLLPKFQIKHSKAEVERDVKLFLESIPKLKFCEQYAQKFLIGVLDSIVKSIKEVNSKIQSRFQCYLWNLELFSTIRNALKGIKGSLIRKQLKLDVNNSSNLLERMKGVDRSESLLKYAQQIFNVLKTGMPVINELTLDFTKYINEHCEALQNQFVKDILYIYAKNMIQFLQKLAEASKAGEEAAKEVCKSHNIQSLYSSYVLSLQKYVKDCYVLLQERNSYKFSQQNSELISNLLDVVYDKLFDFLDKFYVKVSVYASESQNFKEIEVLKKEYKKGW